MPSLKFIAKVFKGSLGALSGAGPAKSTLAKNLRPVFAVQRRGAAICAAEAFHRLRERRMPTGAKRAIQSFVDRLSKNTDRYGKSTYLFDGKPARDLVLAPGWKLVNGASRAVAGGVSGVRRALAAAPPTIRQSTIATSTDLTSELAAPATTVPAQTTASATSAPTENPTTTRTVTFRPDDIGDEGFAKLVNDFTRNRLA